jgi:hypothetical protein
MNIAFHSNHLGIGGTEVAMFDYAYFNQTLLGNTSIIVAKNNSTIDEPSVVKKFSDNFKVIRYNSFSEVEKRLDENNIDVFYAIKSGELDGVISNGRKTVIHVVFKAYQPHGKVYAYVSEWLSKQMNFGLNPWVPHMINLPKEDGDFREELSIPINDIVIGRYGNYGSFDIPFVYEAIKNILSKRNDIIFLFANTKPFYTHPNIIYVKPLADLVEKVKFINTCDAMLHARYRGETFGIACGEFSVRNKPVFTYGLSPETNHIEILKDKAILYNNESQLIKALNNFLPSPERNWDMYSENFNPNAVMQKFKTVFL